MIKAVIFDMDGVLIDSELAYSYRLREFFEKHGYPYTKQHLNQLIGSSHTEGNRIIKEMTKGTIDPEKMWKQWHLDLKANPLDYMALRVDGAIEIMEYLKEKGYAIGLSSATEKENIISHMKECKLFHYFDAISSGHEVEHSKPYPDVYLKTIHDLGLSAQECIVVEDSFYGIRAAKAAKVHTVYARKVKDLQVNQSEADAMIDDLRDIITILER